MKYLNEIYINNLNMVCYICEKCYVPVGGEWSSYGKIRFAQNKFYFITEGSCCVKIGDKTINAKSGDWLFIPQNTEHSFCNYNDTEFSKIWVHFGLLPDDRLSEFADLPYCVRADENTEKMFNNLYNAYNSKIITEKLMVKSYLFLLFAKYLQYSDINNIMISNDEDFGINNVLEYIHNNISRTITNDELAGIVHIHANHFIRFFKKKTGVPPAQYIKNIRLNLAKKMLENSEDSISSIARAVGIKDAGYLSKQFKEKYAFSPSDYRKFCRNNPVSWR